MVRALEGVYGLDPAPISTIVQDIFLGGASPDWQQEGARGAVYSVLESPKFNDMSPVECFQWIQDNGSRERTREKRAKYVEHILKNEFLPHVDDPTERRVYLGLMIRRLIGVSIGYIPVDDRDHNANKRLD